MMTIPRTLLWCVMLVTSGVWFYAQTDQAQIGSVDTEALDQLRRLILLLCLTYLICHASVVAGVIREYPVLALLIALYPMSTLWSVDPLASLKFSTRVVIFTAFVLCLCRQMSSAYIFYNAALFLAAVTLGSLLVAIFTPYGIMSGIHEGAWRGLFIHKNLFGYVCVRAAALSACCLLFLRLDRPRTVLFVFTLFAALTMIGFSRSGGALLSLLAVLAAVGLLLALRLGLALKGFLLVPVMGIVCVLLAVMFFDPFVRLVGEMLGKGITFTGRSLLWGHFLSELAQRPLLGFGADAYLSDQRLEELRYLVNWDVSSTHSGLLHIALSVGLVGFALFSFSVAAALVRAASALSTGAPFQGYAAICLIVAQVVEAGAETSGGIMPNLSWALCAAAVCVRAPDSAVAGDSMATAPRLAYSHKYPRQ